jgi:hypothetical protein
MRSYDHHGDYGYHFAPAVNHMIFINQLVNALNSTDLTAQTKVIHDFAFALLGRPAPDVSKNKWLCPLNCFLAVDNLRVDGTWKDPNSLTPELAHWAYIMRCIAFREMQNRAKHDDELLS